MSYLREGFRSQVVTTDVIANSMTGLDLQEKMRNYIIQEYQLHGIQHVVLAGDDELIPNRGFYCFVQSSSVYEDYGIPSDLYYSALDGNWNTDGDNMWAEPEEDDLLPEISIGRLSFSNSIELTNMLNKTYKYQFTPIAGEFQKVLMAGENLYNDPETWGSDYLELLIGSRSDNGYLTAGIPTPYAFNKMYDENTNWSSYDLINTLNQGYPMLNHVGHANETYAMKLSNWDITDANFNGLNGTTHNFTVIYTHGCLCGSFDFDDCIAEKMVSISNFAAAFVGNSRYGWFNEGQTEGPSAHLHREFMDALYTDKINRLGAAHSESKIATAPWVTAPGQWEPGAIRWCFYDCNVLGDPLMAVWTNNALNIVTIYPTSIPTGSCSINAGITCNGFGVAGLNCVVMQNGAMIGKSVTDVNGNTTIVFDSPLNDPGVAELVVSGYNCLPTPYTFTIDGNIGLNEPSRVNAITVYPNPVTDNLVVSYEHSSLESVSILLVSSDGKSRVIMEPAMVNAGKHNFSWDASDLASGIYQIKVITGNKTRVGSFIRK
ncbi:MAG: T9SS type A sorting domain-containing protein [Bacteroidales bacterium]|nr:T9SS type A sorting domain-containing protein [Bacteroidales bacterium]